MGIADVGVLGRKTSRTWTVLAAAVLVWAIFAGLMASEAKAAAKPPVDVVFIVDESLSMGPEINAVRNNINYIAAQLETQLDPQYALVGFADGTLGASPRSTPAVIRSNFTKTSGLATATTLLAPDWGAREAGAYATEFAMNNLTGWRADAGVCVVLVTDEDNDGVPGMNSSTDQIANRDAAIAAMDAREAVFFGIIPGTAGNSERDYGPNAGSMSAATGGSVFNVASFVSDPQPVLNALLNACRIAVTQGIILDPLSATNPIGTDHTINATVTDSLGDPVVGTTVNFEVVSGPNTGATGTDVTDSSGEASFTYTSNGVPGTDEIQATSYDDDAQVTRTSRSVKKMWALEFCEDLLISAYSTVGSQFVDLTNVGGAPIIVDGCSFITYNAYTERSIGAGTVPLSGVIPPGETVHLTFAGALPSGPGGIAVLDAPAPADGTPVGAVLADDVTGMVYLNSSMVFGVAHLRVPAHNAIYDCIYGGHGTGPFVGPFASLASCLP